MSPIFSIFNTSVTPEIPTLLKIVLGPVRLPRPLTWHLYITQLFIPVSSSVFLGYFHTVVHYIPAPRIMKKSIQYYWDVESSQSTAHAVTLFPGVFHGWLDFHCLHKQTCCVELSRKANMADIQNDLAFLFCSQSAAVLFRRSWQLAHFLSAKGIAFHN